MFAKKRNSKGFAFLFVETLEEVKQSFTFSARDRNDLNKKKYGKKLARHLSTKHKLWQK